MDRAQRIEQVLRREFTPVSLTVEDDSARHAGHAGATQAGETHFNVSLVSASFAGLSRVDRYRAVHAALAAEFASGLHALGLKLRSNDEVVS